MGPEGVAEAVAAGVGEAQFMSVHGELSRLLINSRGLVCSFAPKIVIEAKVAIAIRATIKRGI